MAKPAIEPEDLDFEMGVETIPDRATFEKLSYQWPDTLRSLHHSDNHPWANSMT
ncbi:MAG: hypothetical protein ACKVHP_01760 [Verrucomicrobiales bacterium]